MCKSEIEQAVRNKRKSRNTLFIIIGIAFLFWLPQMIVLYIEESNRIRHRKEIYQVMKQMDQHLIDTLKKLGYSK